MDVLEKPKAQASLNASGAPETDPREVALIDGCLQMWEEAKQVRSPYEGKWDFISRWCDPAKIHSSHQVADDPLTLTMTDTTAVDASQRSGALLFGYLFGGQEAFAVPKLEGRDKTSHEEDVWFDYVMQKMHKFFKGGGSTFKAAMASTVFTQSLYGTGNIWTGAAMGQLPRFQSTSLFDFWYIPGADGEVEAGFRRFTLTASAAARKYPHAKIQERAQKTPAERMTFLLVAKPRAGGRKGAASNRKPIGEYIIAIDDKVLVSEKGYETQPFAVGKFHGGRANNSYGIGTGHTTAPIAWWLNRLFEATVSGAEKAIDPPLFDFTNGALPDFDRRAGAVNMASFDALGFGNIREAIQAFGPTGDLRPGREVLQMGQAMIDRGAYIDWLSRGDGPRKTATEIYDDRDLRFKSLSGFVADTENNVASPVMDLTFQHMLKYGAFPPLPESLRNETVVFEFRSPLSAAMDQGNVESMRRSLGLAGEIAQFDPTVIDNIDGDHMLRTGARDYGMMRQGLRSEEEVEQIRQKRAEDQQREAEAAQAQAAASALRDGAQGIASLENAGGGQ